MLNIAVVDDEQVHRDILVKYIEDWKHREHLDVRVESFESSEAFYFMWCENQCFDVLFLDIVMSGDNGISLARKLRERGKTITIIFTTGIADYMQEGYEVEAMHYLLKPLDREKVWECLTKCLNSREQEKRMLLFPTEDGLIKIDAEGILYAEAVGHYCMLECMEECFQVKLGIRELEQRLKEHGNFAFCHRSYLVNVRKIARVGKTNLRMDNGTLVPVSRRLYSEINERFIKAFIYLQ